MMMITIMIMSIMKFCINRTYGMRLGEPAQNCPVFRIAFVKITVPFLESPLIVTILRRAESSTHSHI